jgi:leucyl aminopeptidase
VAVLAIAENALDGAAYRPGDVLRTLSGRTVEVVDTDAEGRLVLADALHYAATRFRPRAMVDLATLTGAAVVALGPHRAALYGTDAALLAQLAAAGDGVGERLWPMPIGARHREDLVSDIADLKQCLSGRLLPDASHAAAFLREFTGKVPWAHCDIAGVRLDEQDLPTGFGARLLDRLVELYFEDPDRH